MKIEELKNVIDVIINKYKFKEIRNNDNVIVWISQSDTYDKYENASK